MRCSHLSKNIHPSIRRFFWLSFLLSLLIFPNLSYSQERVLAPSLNENQNTPATSLSDDADTIKPNFSFEKKSLIKRNIEEDKNFQILNSDESGITLELTIPELKTEVQQFDGVRYQVARYEAISYQGCGYTSESGNPRVPVSRILLGVPPEATCRVQTLDDVSNIRTGYRLPPVPRKIIQTSSYSSKLSQRNTNEDIQTIIGKYDESGSAYHSLTNALYPQQLAEVIYDGYIRDQRIITVELRPVQYNPNRRILKVHSRLVVKVNFDVPAAAPNLSSVLEPGAKERRVPSSESKVFEDFYRKKLINYDNAKNLHLHFL